MGGLGRGGGLHHGPDPAPGLGEGETEETGGGDLQATGLPQERRSLHVGGLEAEAGAGGQEDEHIVIKCSYFHTLVRVHLSSLCKYHICCSLLCYLFVICG